MNFVHHHFFIFIIPFLLLYWCLKGKARLVLLILGSYFFYAYTSKAYALLLLMSTLVDYGLGRSMERESLSGRRFYLFLSVSFNLILLSTFKYTSFFVNECLGPIYNYLELDWKAIEETVPPVGISFFTFQTMSYTIDVARGRLSVCKSPLAFASYVALFPQLVAGPIVRASQLLPQLQERLRLKKEDCIEGSLRFARGFVKKACIADSLALYCVDPVFAQASSFSPEEKVLALLAYTFQIYYDFSGYSDMAIGLGRLLGFRFPENFNYPYRAVNIAEFWRRWHMTLSTWLRDYLYIPLGGNRGSRFRHLVNLMITMLLGGLWHGASWMFILWGFLHGLWLVLHRLYTWFIPESQRAKIPQPLAIGLTFFVVMITWLPFRSGNGQIFLEFCRAPLELIQQGSFNFPWDWNATLILVIAITAHCFGGKTVQVFKWNQWPLEFKAIAFSTLGFWLFHYLPVFDQVQPFLYFQF